MKTPTLILIAGLAAVSTSFAVDSHSPTSAQRLSQPDFIQSFPVGREPYFLAFDGENIWVTNHLLDNTVTKLRASDGATLGTFAAGTFPAGILFDSTNIWIADYGPPGQVIKMQPSDGTILGTFDTGGDGVPDRFAFDGENIWVTNFDDLSGTVSKMRPSDGAVLGVYPTSDVQAHAILFDGTYIWVASDAENSQMDKLRVSDGSIVFSVEIGSGAQQLAFDGKNIWVTLYLDSLVKAVKASNGAIVGSFPLGYRPDGVAFDGTNIWVTDYWKNTVNILSDRNGGILHTFKEESWTGPGAMLFDGSSIWVANYSANTVSKFKPVSP